eukprot:1252270-Rhodomonas_salina.1
MMTCTPHFREEKKEEKTPHVEKKLRRSGRSFGGRRGARFSGGTSWGRGTGLPGTDALSLRGVLAHVQGSRMGRLAHVRGAETTDEKPHSRQQCAPRVRFACGVQHTTVHPSRGCVFDLGVCGSRLIWACVGHATGGGLWLHPERCPDRGGQVRVSVRKEEEEDQRV